jgi:hypothetical protein
MAALSTYGPHLYEEDNASPHLIASGKGRRVEIITRRTSYEERRPYGSFSPYHKWWRS